MKDRKGTSESNLTISSLYEVHICRGNLEGSATLLGSVTIRHIYQVGHYKEQMKLIQEVVPLLTPSCFFHPYYLSSSGPLIREASDAIVLSTWKLLFVKTGAQYCTSQTVFLNQISLHALNYNSSPPELAWLMSRGNWSCQ